MKTEQQQEKERINRLLFPEQYKKSAKESVYRKGPGTAGESVRKRFTGKAIESWRDELGDYFEDMCEDDAEPGPNGTYPGSGYGGYPDEFVRKMDSIYVQGYFEDIPGVDEIEASYGTLHYGYKGRCNLTLDVVMDSSADPKSVELAVLDRVRELIRENNFKNLEFEVDVQLENGSTHTGGGWDAETVVKMGNSSSTSSATDASKLQSILDQIGITQEGEDRRSDCINESAFDEESRCKDCTIVALSENRAKFTWYTQEWASTGPLKEFIRCLSYVLKKNNYTTPFSVLYIVESRDGPAHGSYKGTVYFDGKRVTVGVSSVGESLEKCEAVGPRKKKSSAAKEGIIVDRVVPCGHYDYDGDLDSFYKEVDADVIGDAIRSRLGDELMPDDELRCYLDDALGDSDDSYGEGAGMLIQFNMYGDHDEGCDEDDPYPYDRMTDNFRADVYDILAEKLPKMHLRSKDFFIRISFVWDRVYGHDAVTDYDAKEFLGE